MRTEVGILRGSQLPAHSNPATSQGLSRLLSGVATSLKKVLWTALYEFLASKNDRHRWAFMNYGYVDLDPHMRPLALALADQDERYCAQLYHHMVQSVGLRGLDILDVGCGHGGGCAYLMRYLSPRAVVGLDISRKAIEHCKRHHGPGISFYQGDAESLQFADHTFDAVISVESSHCYSSIDRFLEEVRRVLRPNGLLLLADMRHHYAVRILRTQVRSSAFILLKEETITPNVLRALELDSKRRLALIDQKIPRLLRWPMRHFAGIQGTSIYEALRTGRAEYLAYTLQKPAS